MGHEFMGEVVEVGSENKKLRAGDRVVVPFTIRDLDDGIARMLDPRIRNVIAANVGVPAHKSHAKRISQPQVLSNYCWFPITRAASAVITRDNPKKSMLMPTRRPIAQSAELGHPAQIR